MAALQPQHRGKTPADANRGLRACNAAGRDALLPRAAKECVSRPLHRARIELFPNHSFLFQPPVATLAQISHKSRTGCSGDSGRLPMGDDGDDGGDHMPEECFDNWAGELCAKMTASDLGNVPAAQPVSWTEEEGNLAKTRAEAAIGSGNMTMTIVPQKFGNPPSVRDLPGVERPVRPAEPRDAGASVSTANVRPRYACLYTYRYTYHALTFPCSALPCLPASRTTSSMHAEAPLDRCRPPRTLDMRCYYGTCRIMCAWKRTPHTPHTRLPVSRRQKHQSRQMLTSS